MDNLAISEVKGIPLKDQENEKVGSCTPQSKHEEVMIKEEAEDEPEEEFNKIFIKQEPVEENLSEEDPPELNLFLVKDEAMDEECQEKFPMAVGSPPDEDLSELKEEKKIKLKEIEFLSVGPSSSCSNGMVAVKTEMDDSFHEEEMNFPVVADETPSEDPLKLESYMFEKIKVEVVNDCEEQGRREVKKLLDNEPGNPAASHLELEYRLNDIMVKQHDASMPLTTGSSLTMLQDVQIPSMKIQPSVLSTTPLYVAAPQITSIFKSNAQKQQDHRRRKATNEPSVQRPRGRSSTERVREYRLRKAAVSFMENVMLKAEIQHDVTSNSASSVAAPQKTCIPKSNAERQRDYRRRKAAKRRLELRARVGKSSTERVREFRLRRAGVSLLKSNRLETTTTCSSLAVDASILTPVAQKQHESVKEAFTQTTHFQLESEHKTMSLTNSTSLTVLQDVPVSSTTATSMGTQYNVPSTSASTLAAPQIIRVAKSNAERQRDYRRRKAMEKHSENTAQKKHEYTERESVEEESTQTGLLQIEWGQLSGFLQDRQHEIMPLTTSTSMETEHNVTSNSASSVAAPQKTHGPKSNAERQRDYRRRKAAARRLMQTHSAVQSTAQTTVQ